MPRRASAIPAPKAARPDARRAAAAPTAADDRDAERGEHAADVDAVACACQTERAVGDQGSERTRDKAEGEALERHEPREVAAARAAGAQQREIAPIALRRSERREVRETERGERARHGEHDVERFRV